MPPNLREYDSSDDEDDAAARLSAAIDYILSLPEERQTRPDQSSRNGHTSRDKKQEHENAVYQEFGDKVHQVKPGWATELYQNLATDDDIVEYLRGTSSGYDMKKGCWAALSREQEDEAELRSSLISITSNIIGYFYPSPRPGVARSVIDSHNLLLPHDNGKHASRPSISIKATGPSFEVPRNPETTGGLGYTNVTGVIDARLDRAMGDELEQATQLSVHCRYVYRGVVSAPGY